MGYSKKSSIKTVALTKNSFILYSLILIVISLVIGGFAIKIINSNTQSYTFVDVGTGHLPPQGSPNAPVTVVEFADARCPFCKALYNDGIQRLRREYIATGKVKFYFRHYPLLGPESVLAANAMECANEQHKFWELHNYFYTHQPDESDVSMYTVDNLTDIATNLGMDRSQFYTCLSTEKYQNNVKRDFADGQKAGVHATPIIFINGEMMAGSQPFSVYKSVIDLSIKN